MKPVMILPPGAMSAEDIALLNANDLCVVVADDPAAVRFLDPLPAQSSRNDVENAAIRLTRCLLTGEGFRTDTTVYDRSVIASKFALLLMESVPLGQEAPAKPADKKPAK